MAKQRNYTQDITPFLSGDSLYIGKSVFRFSDPDDSVVSSIIGDNEIGLDSNRENIEIHVYSQSGTLVKSVRIPFSEGFLYVRNDSYADMIHLGLEIWNPNNREDSLLEKYLSDITPGFYNVVINFFSDEIGSYNNRSWTIKQISSTRTEIIVEPKGPLNRTDFEQFVYTSIFVTDFDALMRVVFNGSTNYSELKSTIVGSFPEDYRQYYLSKSQSYRNALDSALDKIVREIFISLESYTKKEREAGRFRITDVGFRSQLSQLVYDVVGNNLSFLPEGGTVIRNQ